MSRILLVDDESDIRSVFRDKLEVSGFEVEEAESAEQALAKLHDFRPDVVITDVRMDGITGLELLARIRESMNEVDVIVMTGHDAMASAVEAMKLGAFDYLVKPVGLEQLQIVVDRCLEERRLSRNQDKQKEKESDKNRRTIVGRDPKMIEIFKMVGILARNRATVLIRGETGTGKEMVARAVHDHSLHAEEPFIAVNCTALADTLLESELFGHVRGAFTGAVAGKKGYFELAGKGTIFLDEIGDTSPEFQSKLLRVLQEREYYPVGGEQPKTTGARVVAATHQHMEELVSEGGFREDLYFRLRVVEIQVPNLREREGDIPLLAEHLLARVRADIGSSVDRISEEAMRSLTEYEWPGNVRELENVLTRAAMVARGQIVVPEHLTLGVWKNDHIDANIEEVGQVDEGDMSLSGAMEKQITRVMKYTSGNKTRAAKLLKISRSKLAEYLENFNL